MSLITCPMCAFEFDPAGYSACSSCPLQPGCQLVCCPNCGYELVDVRASKLANAAQVLMSRLQLMKKEVSMDGRTGENGAAPTTLANAQPGVLVSVLGFSNRLSDARQAHLLAYGLTLGQKLRVLQHSPVTIVQIDHTELALERQLAEWIEVQGE